MYRDKWEQNADRYKDEWNEDNRKREHRWQKIRRDHLSSEDPVTVAYKNVEYFIRELGHALNQGDFRRIRQEYKNLEATISMFDKISPKTYAEILLENHRKASQTGVGADGDTVPGASDSNSDNTTNPPTHED